MIKTINCKWTLVVSQLCYSVYICVQFYPSFATLIPGAVVVGFGAAPNVNKKKNLTTEIFEYLKNKSIPLINYF